MQTVEIIEGTGPVVLGMPHGGTAIPGAIHKRLNDTGRELADTDWHIDRLYDDLLPDVTIVKSNIHRYVIDANRDPQGASLYPGQNTTHLCPLTDFDGKPIWRDGEAPGDEDVTERTGEYHTPYHTALAAQLERVRQRHGLVVLYDCHSIRSEIPFLFDGKLPDLNIGTNDAATCAPAIEQAVVDVAASSSYKHTLNGRFKGGWTTRRYGRPEQNMHAIQMEISQSTYMEEMAPWSYIDGKAIRLRRVLSGVLQAVSDQAHELISNAG